MLGFLFMVTVMLGLSGSNMGSYGMVYGNNKNYHGSRAVMPTYKTNKWRGGRW